MNRAECDLYFSSFAFYLSFPAIHLLLRQSYLREDAVDVLRDEIVDRLRLMIKRRNRRHDDSPRLLRAQHILQMNPAEWRIAHTQHQASALLQANIGGARNQIVARSRSNGRERTHRAGNHYHSIDPIAARGNRRADILIRQSFSLRRAPSDKE